MYVHWAHAYCDCRYEVKNISIYLSILPGQPRAAAQPDLICLNLFNLFNLSFRKRSLKIKIC